MSPGEIIRESKRRLLAEEHIVYSLVLLAVVIASTTYAVYSQDHSENVWVVYGAVVAGIFGRSGPGGTRRDSDKSSQ